MPFKTLSHPLWSVLKMHGEAAMDVEIHNDIWDDSWNILVLFFEALLIQFKNI